MNRPKIIALHDINETSYTLDKKIKETLVRGSVLEKDRAICVVLQ